MLDIDRSPVIKKHSVSQNKDTAVSDPMKNSHEWTQVVILRLKCKGLPPCRSSANEMLCASQHLEARDEAVSRNTGEADLSLCFLIQQVTTLAVELNYRVPPPDMMGW